jgi:hypothetical protein
MLRLPLSSGLSGRRIPERFAFGCLNETSSEHASPKPAIARGVDNRVSFDHKSRSAAGRDY